MARSRGKKSFCNDSLVIVCEGTETEAVKEINDQDVAQDLIKAGFVVALDSAKPEKAEEKPLESPAPKKAGRKPKKESDS